MVPRERWSTLGLLLALYLAFPRHDYLHGQVETAQNALRLDISPVIPASELSSYIQSGYLLRVSWMGSQFPFAAMAPSLDLNAAFFPGIERRSMFIYSLLMSISPPFPVGNILIRPTLGLGLRMIGDRNLVRPFGITLPTPRLRGGSGKIYPDLQIGFRVAYRISAKTDVHASIIHHYSSAHANELSGAPIQMTEVLGIGLTTTLGPRRFRIQRFQKDYAKVTAFSQRWDEHWASRGRLEKGIGTWWQRLVMRDILKAHQGKWEHFLKRYPPGRDYGGHKEKVFRFLEEARENLEILDRIRALRSVSEDAEKYSGTIQVAIDSLHRFHTASIDDFGEVIVHQQLLEIVNFLAVPSQLRKVGQIDTLHHLVSLGSPYYDNYKLDLKIADSLLVDLDRVVEHLRFEREALIAVASGSYPAYEQFFIALKSWPAITLQGIHGEIVKDFKTRLIELISNELSDLREKGELTASERSYVRTLFLFFSTPPGLRFFHGKIPPHLEQLRAHFSEYLDGSPDPSQQPDPMEFLNQALNEAKVSIGVESWADFLDLYRRNEMKLKDTPAALTYIRAATAATNAINALIFEEQRAANCAPCHRQIYDDWKVSYHGKAWTNEPFRRATQNYAKEECLACHAPKPLLETGLTRTPVLREKNREEGINCYSCHAKGNTIHGPYREKTIFHRTKYNSNFRSVKMCQSCHPSNYAEWQQRVWPLEEDRFTCQTCHMSSPGSPRRVSQYALERDDVLTHDWPGAHSLAKLKESFKGVSVSVDRSSGQGKLQIINNAVAHNLPSGIFGRRFSFQAEMLDADKNSLPSDLRGTFSIDFLRTVQGKEGPKSTDGPGEEDNSIKQGVESKVTRKFFLLPEARYLSYRIKFYMGRNDTGRVVLEKIIPVR